MLRCYLVLRARYAMCWNDISFVLLLLGALWEPATRYREGRRKKLNSMVPHPYRPTKKKTISLHARYEIPATDVRLCGTTPCDIIDVTWAVLYRPGGIVGGHAHAISATDLGLYITDGDGSIDASAFATDPGSMSISGGYAHVISTADLGYSARHQDHSRARICYVSAADLGSSATYI
eukprot:452273-Rhodomonas_salina.3